MGDSIVQNRTQASDAIANGKVKWNGVDVKASRQVQIGDQYEIKREAGSKQLIQVVSLTHTCSIRRSNQMLRRFNIERRKNKRLQRSAFVYHTGKRLSKQGRPTKKDRRGLEGLGENNFSDFKILQPKVLHDHLFYLQRI